MQWDNDGEMINGVVNLDLRQLSFTAEYLTGGHKDGRVWTVTNAPLGGAAASGPLDFSAPSLDVNGSPLDIAVLGGITLPNLAPAPAPGNHGQCVSEAARA